MTSNQSPVVMAPGDDLELEAAAQRARATFKYFWRELSWEHRRIVPGLEIAAVKAPFRDLRPSTTEDPEVEHMWLGEIGFDGHVIQGVLLNSPNWLRSYTAGDAVEVRLEEIDDWMYAIHGRVYGGHSIAVLRRRMSTAERRDHDEAWGLDFGDPDDVLLVPPVNATRKKRGLLGSIFAPAPPEEPADPDDEHPMCVNMAPVYREQLTGDPTIAQQVRDGWTLLQRDALAGNAPIVEALLEAGADPRARNPNGETALELAALLGWPRVVSLLTAS